MAVRLAATDSVRLETRPNETRGQPYAACRNEQSEISYQELPS